MPRFGSSLLRLSEIAAFGVALGVLPLRPSSANAANETGASDAAIHPQPTRKRIPYKAVEVQGVIVGQLLPKPSFGLDGAFVFGTETFQFKLGALLLGSPGFALGAGKIANFLAAVTGDVCVAKNVYRNQIRMCMGGQGGGMAHQWQGYERPGRKLTAWWAGTLKADFRHAVTDKFGVMGGVGVVVPIMGPSFRAYDQYGSPTPLVFPGPVGGVVTVGTSWRF